MRTAFVIVVGLFALMLAAESGCGQGLKLGEKYEGEHKGQKKNLNYYVGTEQFLFYNVWVKEVEVQLKAGQRISLSATVTGAGRHTALALQGPSGKMVTSVPDFRKAKNKSAPLDHSEVPSTGKYKIWVISDDEGPFTLTVSSQSEKALDEKALTAKIKTLKKELAELEAQLAELQKKKSK